MNAKDVLSRYEKERLPEFAGIALKDVNQRGMYGNTPLHVAAVRGITMEIEALLRGGADVMAKGEHGYIPLHDAIEQNNLDAVKLLLEAGSPLDAKNDDGDTPENLAISSSSPALLSLFAKVQSQ